MLAALIELEAGGDTGGARDQRPPQQRRERPGTATAPAWPTVARGDRAAARRRRAAARDAAPGPRQLRHRVGRRPRAGRALRRPLGRDGDHRARGRVGLRRDPHRPRCPTATTDVLDGEKISVTSGDRADLIVVWAIARPRPGPRRDQVVRRRARQPGLILERLDGSWASAPPIPRRPARRLPGARRTSWQPGGGRERVASPGRCRRSTTRARSSPRWRSA